MNEKINSRLQQMLDHKEEGPFGLLIRLVAEEVFRVTEWLTLAAAVHVAGAKFQLPLITGVGHVLVSIISAYLGIRSGQWIGAVLGTRNPGMGRLLLIAIPFAAACSYLIQELINGLIKAALA